MFVNWKQTKQFFKNWNYNTFQQVSCPKTSRHRKTSNIKIRQSVIEISLCRNHITFQPNKGKHALGDMVHLKANFLSIFRYITRHFFLCEIEMSQQIFFSRQKKYWILKYFLSIISGFFLNTRSSNFFGFSLPACFFSHAERSILAFYSEKKIFKNSPPDLPKKRKKR